MLDSNKPTSPPILLRGQNIKMVGSYYNLRDTTDAATVKRFIEIGSYPVSIENGFFEVSGGVTTALTHLVWAGQTSHHFSMRDITVRHNAATTSNITSAVYTVADATTVLNDSEIEMRNFRVLGGTLVNALDIKADSAGVGLATSFDFSGLDTFPTLVHRNSASSGAYNDFLRLFGQWRGSSYHHSISQDASGNLTYTNTMAGAPVYPPFSINPTVARPTDVAVVGTSANTAVYYRWLPAGDATSMTISKISLEVTTQNGNISVGIYANSGTGRLAVPGTLKATSGAVACPAIGVQDISLASSVRVNPGDWIAISADNATAAFRSGLTSEETTTLGNGLCMKQLTAHPLPATPSSLIGISGRNILLVGTT
jgi:hypothetical protein